MCDNENVPVIVINNGSKTCKVGFSGNKAPKSIFPSVVGRSRQVNYLIKPC